MEAEELAGPAKVLGVGRGAAARMGDRCFVHPHGYVDGAYGRDLEVAEMEGAYVSVRRQDP